MRSSSKHGNLVCDDDYTGAERDKDLAHDLISNILVWAPAMHHQTAAEDTQGNTKVHRHRFEPCGVMDQHTGRKREDHRSDGVDLDHVAGMGEAEVVDDLQVRAEVAVPAKIAEVQGCRQEAGPNDCTIPEKRVGEEGDWGEELLPQHEQDEKDDAKNQQADNER